MIWHQDFDGMLSRIWDIDWNRFLYGDHLENPIWLPSDACLDGSCVIWPYKHVLRHQDFDHISGTSWDIDWNRFFYGSHLENRIWSQSAAFLNGTVVFIDSENICLETRQQLLGNQYSDNMSPRIWDTDWNRFLYDEHLHNPILREDATYILGNISKCVQQPFRNETKSV